MASAIAHFIVGAALALPAIESRTIREVLPRWAIPISCGALAVAPDLDTIAMRAFGIPYGSFFGHRGFFHSPFFLILREHAVIEARDVDNIYAVPEAYHAAGLDREVLEAFGLDPVAEPDLARWRLINERVRNPEGDVTIAIVGKYTGLKDAYKSLIEALSHGGIANKVKVNLDWIES